MIRQIVTAALLAILLPASAFAQAAAKDRLEQSIDRGLAFLALLQEKDGAWLANGTTHPAVTSLAVMAFLSAGHVPGEGPYRVNVEKGIRWVLTQQRPDGIISATDWDEMYQHAICTMMLCESAAMCDKKTAALIRPTLENAVKRIVESQRPAGLNKGGWRYRYGSDDADLSVSGWQILALRGARNLGFDVPAQSIDAAMQFVDKCRDPRSGGFAYMPGTQVTAACTATGILANELCGGRERHRSQEVMQAGAYLLRSPLTADENHYFYTAYYCSQAMFQLGGNYWHIHRRHMHKTLLDSQQANGGWLTNKSLGPNYATSMALLALTVEYRLLPIYQRDEDAEPAKEK